MKTTKIIISIILSLVLFSCSYLDDEPSTSFVKDNVEKEYPDESNVEISFPEEYCRPYVSEDLKDKIEIFANNCFYYQKDCNKQDRIDDFDSWRIGKWSLGKDNHTLILEYADGKSAVAELQADCLKYLEDDKETIFLPSFLLNIAVTKNPHFDGTY